MEFQKKDQVITIRVTATQKKVIEKLSGDSITKFILVCVENYILDKLNDIQIFRDFRSY